jgi:hypothetical protein
MLKHHHTLLFSFPKYILNNINNNNGKKHQTHKYVCMFSTKISNFSSFAKSLHHIVCRLKAEQQKTSVLPVPSGPKLLYLHSHPPNTNTNDTFGYEGHVHPYIHIRAHAVPRATQHSSQESTSVWLRQSFIQPIGGN